MGCPPPALSPLNPFRKKQNLEDEQKRGDSKPRLLACEPGEESDDDVLNSISSPQADEISDQRPRRFCFWKFCVAQ